MTAPKDRTTRELLRMMVNAHDLMDRAGYPPAPPRMPWEQWCRERAPLDMGAA